MDTICPIKLLINNYLNFENPVINMTYVIFKYVINIVYHKCNLNQTKDLIYINLYMYSTL